MPTTTKDDGGRDSASNSGGAAATFGTLESAYRLAVHERTNLYESYYVDRTHSSLRFLVADAVVDADVTLAFLADIVAPSSALLAAYGK